ncbi:Histidine utilization repressor [Lutibaculum baratangense AMV1]|uniref:Histidine utilization repressor n=2 Tax=Lutibaculum TaxID=1358438 RepID=V4QVP5_9HYPH|nr:Histidine utilization repressor [Lutibaculum baratangense AMV1]
MIPNEVDLAEEFGCARATVNRALRELARSGVIDRRRKAGTRVALNPVRRATLEIPVIRQEVEGRGGTYGYALLSREIVSSPADMSDLAAWPEDAHVLHVRALHLSDGRPYAHEDRWVNLEVAPEIEGADLGEVSANEWLVRNVSYSRGRIVLSAGAADARIAEVLGCESGAPVFQIERTTWLHETPITWVRLSYPASHRLSTSI